MRVGAAQFQGSAEAASATCAAADRAAARRPLRRGAWRNAPRLRTSHGPSSWCRTRNGVTPRVVGDFNNWAAARQRAGPHRRRDHANRGHRLVVPRDIRLHQRPRRIRPAVPGRGPSRPSQSQDGGRLRGPAIGSADAAVGGAARTRRSHRRAGRHRRRRDADLEGARRHPPGVVLHPARLREQPGLVSGGVRAGRRELRRTHADACDPRSADRAQDHRAGGGGVRGTG